MYILTIEVTEQSLVDIIIISILHIRNLRHKESKWQGNGAEPGLNPENLAPKVTFLTTLKASLHSITDYNALKHPTPHLISIATLQSVTMGNCKSPHHSFGIVFASADSD